MSKKLELIQKHKAFWISGRLFYLFFSGGSLSAVTAYAMSDKELARAYVLGNYTELFYAAFFWIACGFLSYLSMISADAVLQGKQKWLGNGRAAQCFVLGPFSVVGIFLSTWEARLFRPPKPYHWDWHKLTEPLD